MFAVLGDRTSAAHREQILIQSVHCTVCRDYKTEDMAMLAEADCAACYSTISGSSSNNVPSFR